MPFQTYQLAMDYIRKDREEKDRLVSLQRWKIDKALKKPEMTSERREIKSRVRHLEYLKIQADINNPKVKYNFDQGISTSPADELWCDEADRLISWREQAGV